MIRDGGDEPGAGDDPLQTVVVGKGHRRLQRDVPGLEHIEIERLPLAAMGDKDMLCLGIG